MSFLKSSAAENFWFEIKAYLRHCIAARSRHGVHSPFVFDLITKVLSSRNRFFDFSIVEAERKKLLRDHSILHVDDFGVGSRLNLSEKRKVSQIAATALQSKVCAQAFSKIVQHFRPEKVLELGTSLGITTSYLALANSDCHVWTIEGATEVSDRAGNVFASLGLNRVQRVCGRFDDVLSSVLDEMNTVDFALMDGHHAYQPTMRYFNQIVERCHENSIVILDDIHWSREMEKAWSEIAQRSDVTASLDFFHFGVVFFQSTREKEHFILKSP